MRTAELILRHAAIGLMFVFALYCIWRAIRGVKESKEALRRAEENLVKAKKLRHQFMMIHNPGYQQLSRDIDAVDAWTDKIITESLYPDFRPPLGLTNMTAEEHERAKRELGLAKPIRSR